MKIRRLALLVCLLLAAGALHAAVSEYVRIVPRTHNFNVSNGIAFRTRPRTATLLIFR